MLFYTVAPLIVILLIDLSKSSPPGYLELYKV
nr:MAG TPA: hypothetical protein [Bacteriophage sp.]